MINKSWMTDYQSTDNDVSRKTYVVNIIRAIPSE